jgi:hypothetical protein
MGGRAILLFDLRNTKLILLLGRFLKLLVQVILVGLKLLQANYVFNKLWFNLLINSSLDG